VPIRTVSSLTGVNSVTLRAWERRYDLIKPVRTPKGHRLYTMADVDLIQQVVDLLDNGMSIGQVRQVLDTGRSRSEPEPAPMPEDPWLRDHQRLLNAITQFDESVLNDIYQDALSLYPVDVVTTRLTVPMLRELGTRWVSGVGSIAEEHFFSVFLRNKLGARFHHLSRNRRGPRLLTACLPGEQHEVGILLFALAALDWNYRVLLLGPNTPLTELPTVVTRAANAAIVLSGSVTIEMATIADELAQLCRTVAVPVFVGGSLTRCASEDLSATGAIVLSEDLSVALRQIDVTLNRH
jgi:DNA-binding transcriptional MerR regulator/methylmalonyl-CoA mutase cobalamin-binding subunit